MDTILNESISQMKKMKTTQKKYNRYAVEHDLFIAKTVMCLTQKEYRQLLND